ncbi:MAG: GNAT family N-acetyltransferase [Deltaproteobacteria bacterium]|nr:GNAT family N-acetyltransferase [Deltaproteobacteria bacterium]
MSIRVVRVAVERTLALRQAVLRPLLRPENLLHPWDSLPTTAHFGAFVENELVGVATFVESSRTGSVREWRLRGMAAAPEFRGRGIGRALIDAGRAFVAGSGGSAIWCHGRESARQFYEKLGFVVCSDRFEDPVSGLHFVMESTLF